MANECVNVVCLKWGTAYGPEYVNRLYTGVKANLARPFRFVCFTDDPAGLLPGVETASFPMSPPGWKYSWPNIFVKLCLFKDGLANLHGPTLFLDIDQIIIGDLGRFFDYKPGEFCIIHNWIELRKRLFRRRPKIGNSSCFRFEAGKMNYVYEKFVSEMDKAVQQKYFRTEQAYMTHAVGLENVNWWPSDWVLSFKRSCMRIFPFNLFFPAKCPEKGSILCFHGNPSPAQAISGYRGRHLNTWVRPCLWVKKLWEVF
jgi:hypothetical protein